MEGRRTEAVVRADGREFHVVGTVRGLASEEARVEEAFARLEPQGLALGVPPEDLEGLAQLAAGAEYEHEYSEADEVYAHYLEQFGAVELPPRDIVAAYRAARERGLPVAAIDLPEAEYVDKFTQAVSTWQLLRYNWRVRRIAKRPPAAASALEFHLWWDREVGRLKGFAALERSREEAMASRLLAAELPSGRVLVLLEAARVEGLLRALAALLAPAAHA